MICISLGSNIEPEINLPRSIELLEKYVTVIEFSGAWQSTAVGTEGPDFINATVLIQTGLTPQEFKDQVIQKIELKMGRVRTEDKYAPRPIDLDILLSDEHLYDDSLFTLVHLAVPTAEILPDFKHPDSGETLAHAAERLSCDYPIQPRPDILSSFENPR